MTEPEDIVARFLNREAVFTLTSMDLKSADTVHDNVEAINIKPLHVEVLVKTTGEGATNFKTSPSS